MTDQKISSLFRDNIVFEENSCGGILEKEPQGEIQLSHIRDSLMQITENVGILAKCLRKESTFGLTPELNEEMKNSLFKIMVKSIKLSSFFDLEEEILAPSPYRSDGDAFRGIVLFQGQIANYCYSASSENHTGKDDSFLRIALTGLFIAVYSMAKFRRFRLSLNL